MSTRRKFLYALSVLIAAALVFSFVSPSQKLVSREPLRVFSSETSNGPLTAGQAIVGGLAPAKARMEAKVVNHTPESPDAPDRKIIRNADLALVVKDVRASSEQIVRMVTSGGGQVDNLNIAETNEGCFNGTLIVRVPSTGLEDAIAQFKGIALRTEKEQISARDVTHEFYDNEAHLRNLRAEEQQYLAIMKQSGKIPDTLEVAQHLSDVRDRIERQQTAMQVMTHDIEMSVVAITLTKQIDTKIAGFEWRPMQNARAATRNLLIGLGEWFDAVVAFLVGLPLVLAWIASVGALLWVLYRVLRWIWRRFRHLLPA
jgi:hypothetical protein